MESSMSRNELDALCGEAAEMSSKVTQIRVFGSANSTILDVEANLDLCNRGLTTVDISASVN